MNFYLNVLRSFAEIKYKREREREMVAKNWQHSDKQTVLLHNFIVVFIIPYFDVRTTIDFSHSALF